MKNFLLILIFYFSIISFAQNASGIDTVYIQTNKELYNQNKTPIVEINSDTLYNSRDSTLFNGILVQRLLHDVDSDNHELGYYTYC